jgi:DNA-binding PadR family transcriptional regulator
MPRINATAACLLGLLQLGPAPGQPGYGDLAPAMTGSQLWRAAATSLARFWNITRSQVFRELPRLEAAGLIEATPLRPRRQQPYRITAAGTAAFASWLAEFTAAGPRDEQLHSPLVLTVFFGEWLAPALFQAVLTDHRRRHAERLEALLAMQRVLGASPRPPAQTVARGIAYQRLTLTWIDGLLGNLAEARPTPAPSSPAVS